MSISVTSVSEPGRVEARWFIASENDSRWEALSLMSGFIPIRVAPRVDQPVPKHCLVTGFCFFGNSEGGF
jgi:hypothetical protein